MIEKRKLMKIWATERTADYFADYFSSVWQNAVKREIEAGQRATYKFQLEHHQCENDQTKL